MKKLLCILLSILLILTSFPALNIFEKDVSASESNYPLLDLSGIDASAKTSHENWGWYVSNLFDGDIATGYTTVGDYDANTHPEIDEWILMDLGKLHVIDKFGFVANATGSYNYLPYAFTIEVSETGEEGTWTTAYSTESVGPLTGSNYPADDPQRSAYFFEFSQEVLARHVKMHITSMNAVSTPFQVRMNQILLYGEEPADYPLLDLSDIQASAKTSYEKWGWYVSNLFDGDLDEGYSTVGPYDETTHPEIDEWVHMDLGELHKMNKVGFAAYAGGSYNYLPYAFSIEVSETGEEGSWMTAYSTESVGPLTGSNYPADDPQRSAYFFEFPEVTARYVNFNMTAMSPSSTVYQVRLMEFMIYGESLYKPTDISITREIDDFILNITGWKEDHQYQIWTWQEVASDAFGNMDQWILAQPYTLGSEMIQEADGSISANLGDVFNSPDKFYTVAVKIIDGDGNFVGQLKDTYTPADVGEVVIEKVEVDGVFADERTIVKNIDDETVGIQVFTNITQDVTYEATVNPGNIALTPEGNSFDWDISALEPGRYNVTLKAQNGSTSDERIVRFNLYKVDETIVYGQMDTMTVTGEVNEGVFAIDISPDIPSGNWVNYTISEPWRAAIYRSDAVSKEAAETGMVNSGISEGEYGIYQVATYVRRSIGGSADDGMIRRVEYARDGAKSLDIEVDGVGYTSGTLTKAEGEQITITPDADLDLSQGEQMEYSYWRRDARGWVMIRDYSPTPGLTWTPARVGLYTIQVRAKGSDAGSYELIQNIEFNVTGTDPLLTVDEITLSGTDNVDARVPVTITAGVVNPSSEDLLYKYIISNDYIYYVETSYSADPTYIWTPGKAGEYRVSVLVKNQASFGKYDDVQTFTVDIGE